MPRTVKQHYTPNLHVGQIRRALRHDAVERKPLNCAVIGRPIVGLDPCPGPDLQEFMARLDVSFTPGQLALVYLHRNSTRKVIHGHGSSSARVNKAIRGAGGRILSPIIVSREELELQRQPGNPGKRTYNITSFPLRSQTARTQTRVNLRDEQYHVSCAVGDTYADEPQLWLGRIEGPAHTDAVEEVLDHMESQLPTTIMLGRVGLILAQPAQTR
jgi:hypothetical protein